MSRGRRELSHLTRRELLSAALATFLAARAEAQQQVSKADAAYQATPKDGSSCALCSFFVRPASCKVVSGDISPNGWCKLFDLSD